MARLIGETPPGPLPPPPPLKAQRDIILWLVALSCIGETEGPKREPRGIYKGA